MTVPCIVCGTAAERRRVVAQCIAIQWDCPRCGAFATTETADVTLRTHVTEAEIDRSVLSHLLRIKYENLQSSVPISDYDYPFYKAQKLPNPQEQANNLILWIGANQRVAQEQVEVPNSRLAAIVGCAINLPQEKELGLEWLIDELQPAKLFEAAYTSPRQLGLKLSMAGWQRYQELTRFERASMTAFMAMSFRAGEIDLMDRVLADCFKPAAKRAGFDLQKITDGQGAGLIDDQIRVAIRKARFVVADLTHDNNGAYFEAGFAEGLGIPVMYTCEASKFKSGRGTHFDTNHMNTVQWSADNLEAAGRELTAVIRNTLPNISRLED